ncbi:MAG: DpnD/PcfM family protein [Bacteroidaceae bacterium]|nr:DpnD/PcfM family protein [Bacteroidaceae bacterium]
MTKYKVDITETLNRTIETEAESKEIAVEKVRQMYRNCDIILGASDYVETIFSVKK